VTGTTRAGITVADRGLADVMAELAALADPRILEVNLGTVTTTA
jgi:hypothetical protein